MIKRILVVALFFVVNNNFSQEKAIRVEVIGKGDPILFLPGFITPGSVWAPTLKNLQTKSESHLFSYAGFDGVAPIQMPWYKTVKEDIFNYILENNLKKFQIIGHSMGGNLAVDIAARFPERVEKMVLVDALPCIREVMMPGVAASNLHYESPYNKRMLGMDDIQFKGMAMNMARGMTSQKEKVSVLANWIQEADRKTYVYGYTDLLKLDLRDALSAIKTKTLILGASFPTAAVMRENFEKQYANLSNKTIEIATNSKHFIMFDQPAWFYNKLTAFLDDE